MKISLSTFALMLVFLSTALLTSCKKGNDPMPAELSAKIVGKYTYSSITTGGKTYPANQTQLTGTVNVVRESATTVTMQLDINSKVSGPFLQGSASNLTVMDTGNNEVNLVKDNDIVGKGGNGKLVIRAVDDNGEQFDIALTK